VPRDRIDRARGALLGTFVGDALGMPYEGSPPSSVPERIEMLDARLGPGTYTDDTEMMIVLAETLLESDRVDPDELGRAFLAAYDPRRGYGAGTRAVLALVERGMPASEAAQRVFDGRGSFGNGAAMRVAPVAVRFADDRARVVAEADRSARATHAHPFGIDAARVQAAAVAAALRDEDVLGACRRAAATAESRHRLDAVEALLDGPAPAPAEVARRLGNSSAGQESVPAALYAALARGGFAGAVTFAVRCGGDADTIGAMTGAIAGARHGATAIPTRWRRALEDRERGRSHVERLAERLVTERT
jgi:poly(ADP-ribose) glycohydrolase ARH3